MVVEKGEWRDGRSGVCRYPGSPSGQQMLSTLEIYRRLSGYKVSKPTYAYKEQNVAYTTPNKKAVTENKVEVALSRSKKILSSLVRSSSR